MRTFILALFVVGASAAQCSWSSCLQAAWGVGADTTVVGCGNTLRDAPLSLAPAVRWACSPLAAGQYTVMLVENPGATERNLWVWSNLQASDLNQGTGVFGARNDNAAVSFMDRRQYIDAVQYNKDPNADNANGYMHAGQNGLQTGLVATDYRAPVPGAADTKYEFRLFMQAAAIAVAQDSVAVAAAGPAAYVAAHTLTNIAALNQQYPWFTMPKFSTVEDTACTYSWLNVRFGVNSNNVGCGGRVTLASAATAPLVRYNAWQGLYTVLIVDTSQRTGPFAAADQHRYSYLIEASVNVPFASIRDGVARPHAAAPGIHGTAYAFNGAGAANSGDHKYSVMLFKQTANKPITLNNAAPARNHLENYACAGGTFRAQTPAAAACAAANPTRTDFDWWGWSSQPHLQLRRVAHTTWVSSNPDTAAAAAAATFDFNNWIWIWMFGGW